MNKMSKIIVLCLRKSHHWNRAEAYGRLPQHPFTYLFLLTPQKVISYSVCEHVIRKQKLSLLLLTWNFFKLYTNKEQSLQVSLRENVTHPNVSVLCETFLITGS